MIQVKVDGFEGTLAALLELLERQQADITALPALDVLEQHLRQMDCRRPPDPDDLADFIGMGAKLLYLKSCALLPSPAVNGVSRPAEDDSEDLGRMLEEYRRFKDVAALLKRLEDEGRRTYTRKAPPKDIPLPPGLKGVTLDTLVEAVKEALSRKPEEGPKQEVLKIDPVTVGQKVDAVRAALKRGRGKLDFRQLLEECRSRTEIVVLFLAVLELIKTGRLWAEQPMPFGEIVLVETAEPDAT